MNENFLMLSDRTYEVTKRVVQVVFPATASLYYGLAAIWNLPASEQVVGTLAVVTTFLGLVLGISARSYYSGDTPFDGNVVIQTNEEGKKLFSLELSTSPDELEAKRQLSFKVQDTPEAPSDEM